MPDAERIPPKFTEWLRLFREQAWNGRITVHLHEGQPTAIEPQPNVKLK